MHLPGFNDVMDAATRLKGLAVRTPLLWSPALDEAVGGRVLIKAECLQRTGSFKFRGAYNALALMTLADRVRGVVAFSSGNHAQGVAEAAQMWGIRATIVMPADAPAIKAEGVRARGGKVITYDRASEDREAISRQLCEETGATLIPSFDHFGVIAGQGTCGLEIVQQLEERGETADQLVCCVGGGGLIAGINLALAERAPEIAVYGAEPEGFDDHARSLVSGQRERNTKSSGSLQDALLSEAPGEMTFSINQPRLKGIGVVSDDEAMQAVAFAWQHLKLVIEPGGACALAAVLSGKIDEKGKTTVIVATGGNVDAAVFAKAIGG
ncbi:threonine/serine dehydratase [Glycocaulis abyssi]|uniref:Threonine/serine dehydratase n=1 Tax=Glycocaulis abyssi TaxID=1433403 RepID=A0ABV9N7V1_9PROT